MRYSKNDAVDDWFKTVEHYQGLFRVLKRRWEKLKEFLKSYSPVNMSGKIVYPDMVFDIVLREMEELEKDG